MRTPKAVMSLAFLIALALGSLAVPADGASPKKQCIRTRCNAQKKACLAGFRSQFTAVKAACGDGKCKRDAKRGVPLTQGGTGTVTAGGASLVSWTFTDVPPTTRR